MCGHLSSRNISVISVKRSGAFELLACKVECLYHSSCVHANKRAMSAYMTFLRPPHVSSHLKLAKNPMPVPKLT